MEPTYLKQGNEPLFPKLLWSRPVNRSSAGRLLLIGGHSGDFSEIQAVYQAAIAAGIGKCTVVLPDSLRKLLGELPDTYFVSASPSGSLDKSALGEILNIAEEFDGIAIGASLSKNSQTTVLIESLIARSKTPLAVYGEALDVIKYNPGLVVNRPGSLIVATMPELFRLAGELKIAIAIRPERGVIGKIDVLAEVAAVGTANYVLFGPELAVASGGRFSLTSLDRELPPAVVFGVLAAWWLQNTRVSFEGLTTGTYVLAKTSQAASDSTLNQALKALTDTQKATDESW